MTSWYSIEPIDSELFFERYNIEDTIRLLKELFTFCYENYPNKNELRSIKDQKEIVAWHEKCVLEDFESAKQNKSFSIFDHRFLINECDFNGDYSWNAKNKDAIWLKNAEKWLGRLTQKNQEFNQFKVRQNYEY